LIKLIKSQNFQSFSTSCNLIALDHHFYPFLHPRFTALPLQRYLHNSFNQNSSESRKQKISMTSVSRHRSNVKIHQQPPLSWNGWSRGREYEEDKRLPRARQRPSFHSLFSPSSSLIPRPQQAVLTKLIAEGV